MPAVYDRFREERSRAEEAGASEEALKELVGEGVRVFALARDLNVTSGCLVRACNETGVPVRNLLSLLTQAQADAVRRHVLAEQGPLAFTASRRSP
jgi:hypothetical protein